jgi:hypothetical protein
MAGVMGKIEDYEQTCKNEDRAALVTVYWLYHKLTGYRGSDSERLLKRYEKYFETCGIETLAVWPLLYDGNPPWAIEECVAVFQSYLRTRYHATALRLPVVFEIAIMAQIANLCLGCGDPKSFVEWADRSVLEAAGRSGLQEYLYLCKRELRTMNPRVLIGLENPNTSL